MSEFADIEAIANELGVMTKAQHDEWQLRAVAELNNRKPRYPKPSTERNRWSRLSDLVSGLVQGLQSMKAGPAVTVTVTVAPPPPPPPQPVLAVPAASPLPEIPEGSEWFRDRVCRKDRAQFILLLEDAHRHRPLGLIDQGTLAASMRSYLQPLMESVSDPYMKSQINKFMASPDQHMIDNLVQDMRSPCQNFCSMAGHHSYNCPNPASCVHTGCKSSIGGQVGHLIRVPMMVAAEFRLLGIQTHASEGRYYKIVL